MSFGGLILTTNGRNEIAKAELGTPFLITNVVFGDGRYSGSYTNINEVVNTVLTLPIARMERNNDEVTLEIDFSSKDIPAAFYLREIGIIANGKLCYYDNAHDDAEYLDPNLETIVKQKRMRFVLYISSEAEVVVNVESQLYALAEDLVTFRQELGKSLEGKVDKIEGKGLSANDFTDEEKDKLAGIAEGANNYIHPETHPAEMIEQDSGHRMVTDAEKAAWDVTYQQATAYVDSAIAELIDGAPSTLDTLKEIADAMAENQNVVEALEEAIGSKANQAELDTHTGNSTIHIISTERTKWNEAVTKARQNAAAVEQLNTDLAGKQPSITGAASSIASSNLTARQALISSSSGKVAVSAVTSTELGCLAGVTSNVQTQLNGKQAKLINPLVQTDVVNNLTSTETKKPLSANQGKILNDKISQKSRLYVQLVTITGNGSNWIIVNSAGKYLVAAQTIREDTDYYVTGINKQNADGLYTLLFNRDVSDRTTLAAWITWMD